METFARVAEARSFSTAARELGLSKGAVSKAIAALEDELGCRLLNRSTRQVTLTAEGEIYLRSCQTVVAEAERAERAVRELHDAPRGLVRVNSPTGFASLFLAPALPGFFERYPEVQVELHGDDNYVDVAHGGWDVVVRIGQLKSSALIGRRLAAVGLSVVASPGYLAKKGTPRKPADLVEHDCITYALMNPPDVWRFVRRGKRESVRVSGHLRVNADATQLAALLADGGVAALPSYMVQDELRSGRLVQLLAGWEGGSMSMYALMPPARAPAAKVRVFMDYLVERFARECPTAG